MKSKVGVVVMTFNDADKIVSIWGKYLEFVFGRLHCIFGRHIPESLLPFTKDTLYEAINIMAEYYKSIGNTRGVELMNETSMIIHGMYVDDEKALQETSEWINDPKRKELMIGLMKKWQKDWIITQGHFDGSY